MFKKSLTFYGFLFICLEVSKSQNSFFLSKKYNNNNYICATNSSDALSWIIEDITEKLEFVSSYTPTTQSNNFNCDIKNDVQTKRYFIKQPWTLQKSIETHLNDVILDERWEEFPVIKTDYNNREGSRLEYTNVLNIQNTDFVIPLSIRLEQEGHIFLCDGTNPSTSSCYWFMLQAFGGKASSIRKCQQGFIPSVNNKYPSGSCKVRRVNSTHSQDFLTNKKWSHFLLSKQKQILTFSTIVDHKKSKILEWEDTENPIPVSNLFVHSKVFNGLWKVHNLDFIYTRDVNKKVNLGSEILVLNNTVCISMYISMCSSCQIQLSLRATSENIDNRTFEATQSGWNHIKYITEIVTVSQIWFHVHTMGGNQDSYWAIDKVRLCQKKEFRIIGLSEEVKCQLISGSEVIQYDRHTRNDDDNDAKNNCPENTVGDFCMPCEMIYGDCKEITICTKDRCTCSAGYRSDVCYSECERGYYGHGCQRQCGKCHYCNNVDGTCRGTCTDNYTGSKCDIPPSIFFAVPPHVNSVSYTEAKISVSNFTVENHLNSQPQKYTIEYKKAQNFDMPWTATNEFSLFNEPHEFTIKDLEPETSYIVRSVIILVNDHWEVGDHLKYSKFTTACQDIDESNINIDVSKTTANVSLLQTTKVTCKLYTISLLENGQSGESNNNRTFFENLTPFTEYTVIFQRKEQIQKKRFKTLEGVPSEIKSLSLKTISSTSIELRWKEPREVNGELKYYSVDYEHQRYLGCNFTPNVPIEKNNKTTKETSIIVTNLKPYSSYTFNVAVVNGKFKGPSISESAETQPSNKIEKDEIPTISLAENSLHLSSITCEKFRGPLILSITTTCVSEWCQNSTQSQKTESRTLNSQIDIHNLIPFSDYNLDLKFCRYDTVCTETQNRSFKSQPTEPPQVQNLLAYTKNSSSISLRWEPPYPPNGNLKEYKITYYDNGRVNQKEIIFGKTPCKIWPNLHCVTLHNLKTNHYYKIEISAKNQKPNTFGPPATSQKIKTVIEKSDPPYDLKIEWTKQNDLKLEWKHPNISNGDVKFFNIWKRLENEQNPKQEVKKMLNVENKYNLTYYYEIKGQEFSPTTEYRIFVATNNIKESDPVTQNSTSPPEIPKISTETQFENSNDTIMVSFSLDKPQGKSDGYQIFVLKPGSQNSKNFDNELSEFKAQNMTSLICEVNPAETPKLKIILGSNQGNSGCTDKDNPPLRPGTSYNITIVVINKFKNISRVSAYSYAQRTLGEVPSEIQKKRFKTLEGVQSEIKSLSLKTISSTSIQLRWKKPREINGELKYYSVDYEHQRYLGCNFTPNVPVEKNNKTTKETSIIVTNLKPYSSYTFNVAVVNGKFKGPSISESAETQPSNKIEKDEIPTISLAENSLHLSSITCEKFRGPLILSITTTCVSEWCQNSTQSQKTERRTLDSQIDIHDLIPFSDYNLDLKFCRYDTVCTETQNRSFKSQPTEPPPVQNLLAYTKNSSSISLRWEPPYPPNGNLKEYKITYYEDHKENQKEIIFKKTPCKIWPNLHCVTLHNLKTNHYYTIQISARNKIPPIFATSTSIKNIRTTIESPGPPIDLNVQWSLENNLEIKWKHPVEANGDIQYFNITVLPDNEKNYSIYEIINISSPINYKSSYLRSIKADRILLSKMYTIRISAYNSLKGNETILTDVSPPDIPTFETDPEIHTLDDRILIRTFRIQKFQALHKYSLYLFVVNKTRNNSHHQNELKLFEKRFNMSLSELQLVCECSDYKNSTQFTVGRTNHTTNNCKNLTRIEVTAETTYNITILLVHRDSTKTDKSSYKMYSYITGKPGSNLMLLLTLLLLLLIIPIVIFTYKKIKNEKLRKTEKLQNLEMRSNQLLLKPLNHRGEKKLVQESTASVFSQNLQHLIKNKALKQQHQELLQSFPNIYEEVANALRFEHLHLNFKNNRKLANAYVVSEFPQPKQTCSFWNKIWKQNIENIVLMDNLCVQESYWPALNTRLVYKTLSVQCVLEEIFPEYEFRKFIIVVKDILTINHFRFTSWSDQDLPDHLTCLHFFRKISQIQMKPESPILFHSRTGLRGTGFAMLCDMSLRIAEEDHAVDVFKTAHQLADYSTKLVDNYECYELTHFVILECLLASDVDIDIDFDFQDPHVKSLFKEDKLQKYLTYMKNTKWIDRNREISRESYLYFFVDGPQYTGATVLKPCYPRAEINATLQNFGGITIQSPRGKKIVLIRQPTTKNLTQFWKIVTEMKIFEIIVLNQIEHQEGHFWTKKNSVDLGTVTIKNTSTKKLHIYDWITITILVDKEKKERKVEIFEIQNWSSESLCPPNVADFVSFCLETYSMTNNSNPMLVICRDGTTASSLYTAIYYIIHKIQKEQKLDVYTSARLVRKFCPKFAEIEGQVKFLWRATEECVNQKRLYE